MMIYQSIHFVTSHHISETCVDTVFTYKCDYQNMSLNVMCDEFFDTLTTAL